MSKMMPAFASKLKRKQPTVKVQSPSDAEPEAKDTKGLVKAAYTGAMPLRECQSLSLRGGVPQQTEPMWPLS